MSRVIEDKKLANPRSMSPDELHYARDRGMITDEQFVDGMGNREDEVEDDPFGPVDYTKMSAKEVKAEYDRRVASGRQLVQAKSVKEAIAALESDDSISANEATRQEDVGGGPSAPSEADRKAAEETAKQAAKDAKKS